MSTLYCTYNHFISCIDEYGSSTPHRPSSFNRSRSFSYSSSQLSMATSLPGMFVLARMCAHVNFSPHLELDPLITLAAMQDFEIRLSAVESHLGIQRSKNQGKNF